MMRDAAFAVIREIGVETADRIFSLPFILKRAAWW